MKKKFVRPQLTLADVRMIRQLLKFAESRNYWSKAFGNDIRGSLQDRAQRLEHRMSKFENKLWSKFAPGPCTGCGGSKESHHSRINSISPLPLVPPTDI